MSTKKFFYERCPLGVFFYPRAGDLKSSAERIKRFSDRYAETHERINKKSGEKLFSVLFLSVKVLISLTCENFLFRCFYHIEEIPVHA